MRSGLSVVSRVVRYLRLAEDRLGVRCCIISPGGGATGFLASNEQRKVFAASGKSGGLQVGSHLRQVPREIVARLLGISLIQFLWVCQRMGAKCTTQLTYSVWRRAIS
ncbi:hypothetical protein M758_UG034600 [Ceratodon purpureus]|nr:hypothetical protein M758_UG034600 [Ceratodon purpureus]